MGYHKKIPKKQDVNREDCILWVQKKKSCAITVITTIVA
jgi:hypothetical protein